MNLRLIFATLVGGCCGNDPIEHRRSYDQEALNALGGLDAPTTWRTDTGIIDLSPEDFSCEALCDAPSDPAEVLKCDFVQPDGDDLVAVECLTPNTCVGGRRHRVIETVEVGRGPSATAAALAQMAHDEWASVHAFLALADELRGHDAPGALVMRVLEAARDEVRHGQAVAAEARARGGIVPVPVVGKPMWRTLEAIARENVVQGVVNETWLALVAQVQARAAEPSLRALFATIAMDETRHAELAYDLDRWFRSQLDAQAIAGLDAAREQAVVRLMRRVVAESSGSTLGRPRADEALRLAGGLSDLYWS